MRSAKEAFLTAVVTIGIFSACGRRKAIEQLRVAYAYDNNLYVITGTGTEVLKLSAKPAAKDDWVGQHKLAYGFAAPAVSPNKNSVVCVRSNNYDPKVFPSRGTSDLVEISLKKGEKVTLRTLYSPSEKEFVELDAPAWSPNGERIAFLQGRKDGQHTEIIVLESVSRTIAFRIDIPEAVDASPGRNNLFWSEDGKRIIIWTIRNEGKISDRDIGILSFAPLEFRWLGHAGVENKSGFTYGIWEQSISTPDEVEAERLLMRGAYERKLGSNSSSKLIGWSPDRRYAFYLRKSIRITAKEWIERYDTSTKESTSIKTNWWLPIYFE